MPCQMDTTAMVKESAGWLLFVVQQCKSIECLFLIMRLTDCWWLISVRVSISYILRDVIKMKSSLIMNVSDGELMRIIRDQSVNWGASVIQIRNFFSGAPTDSLFKHTFSGPKTTTRRHHHHLHCLYKTCIIWSLIITPRCRIAFDKYFDTRRAIGN